mmetsp:Transcript_81831/g.244069  ORF Transcript_81831/g.244069 Transcript_81831/m.244069 type:complete len:182 (-) Transcript_81831:63-608(-)
MGGALSSVSPGIAGPEGGMRVRLNIYDLGTSCTGTLVNSFLGPLGSGAFHCGVELVGMEWSFRSTSGWKGTGVFSCKPRRCKGHTYRETLDMGYCSLSQEEVILALEGMILEWRAANYNVLRCNCCHFSDELCARLGVGWMPGRLLNLADTSAYLGSACGLLGPAGLLEDEDAEELVVVRR